MNDPRTMTPAKLRAALRENDRMVRGLWLLQAAAFRRIQKEELFREWGFDSVRAYLTSDLPEVEYRTAKRMMQALAYVEEREPEALDLVLGGGGASAPMLPNYTEVARLDSLAMKVAKDEVSREDYEALHRAAFAGEVTGQEVRRRVRALTPPAAEATEDSSQSPGGEEREQDGPPTVGVVEALGVAINAMCDAPDDGATPEALAELLRVFQAKHGAAELRRVLDRVGVATAAPAEGSGEVVVEKPARKRRSKPVEATAPIEEAAPADEAATPPADPPPAGDAESTKPRRVHRRKPPKEHEPAPEDVSVAVPEVSVAARGVGVEPPADPNQPGLFAEGATS